MTKKEKELIENVEDICIQAIEHVGSYNSHSREITAKINVMNAFNKFLKGKEYKWKEVEF